MLSRFLPGLRWLNYYSSQSFRCDVLSGLTIAFMLIPQGMGYAMVAGLPPEAGLYACIFPPIVYAFLGTSNKISIGPVALDSILILNGLHLLNPASPEDYLALAITMTLMVGLIQLAFGYIKFGFIANFLSYPVIVGYTSAAALVIIASQLENMVGVKAEHHSFFPLVNDLIQQFKQWHLTTLAIGVLGFGFVHYGKWVYKGLPYGLLLIIIGMFFSGTFGATERGIDVIAHIPAGLPSLSIPTIDINTLFELLPLAMTVALMGYAGSMSICKSQEKPDDPIKANPNQELVAMGWANITAAFFKAFPVSASFSRSAAFRQAGAVTQISGIVSALFIVLILVFLTPVFEQFPLPKALLAAIIISSVIGLFKIRDMKQQWHDNKTEFAILMATFTGTLTFGVQAGLFVGIGLSIAMVILNTARPHMTELGAIQQGKLFRNISRFSEATVRDDVLIFRFDAPLYFANKDYFVDTLYRWINRRTTGHLQYIVFNAESVGSIDTSSIHMLHQTMTNCQRLGMTFMITNAIGPVRDALKNSILKEYMNAETMFTTVHDALMFIDSGINQHAEPALQSNR